MEIQQAQEDDPICQEEAQYYCREDWPEKGRLKGPIKWYYPLSSEISIVRGLFSRNERIIIPAALQRRILNQIYAGHQGINKCRERAKQSVWWPGLSTELESIVDNCRLCRMYQAQKTEPMLPFPFPDLPWQRVGMDLFKWKKHIYLIIVDYYSRFIEVGKLDNTSAGSVILRCKNIFARHGIPEQVVTDNGPQFDSNEFRKFAREYQFRHITNSPYYPRCNGEAERGVKTVKELLKKATSRIWRS